MSCSCTKRDPLMYALGAGAVAAVLHSSLNWSGSVIQTAGLAGAATYFGLQYYNKQKENCDCAEDKKGLTTTGEIAAAKQRLIRDFGTSEDQFYYTNLQGACMF